jgi:hypothetical protein
MHIDFSFLFIILKADLSVLINYFILAESLIIERACIIEEVYTTPLKDLINIYTSKNVENGAPK